jgi:hypothetical protein
MPARRYDACPVCGWEPDCEYLRDERDLNSEDRHERVVEHVRQTEDTFHDSVEEAVELA